MGWTYAFWALSVACLLGLVLDISALRRGVSRTMARTAVALKSVVAVAFASWWVALRMSLFDDWQDLTTFALILVLSLPALAAALVCDAVVASQLRGASE